MEMPFKIPHLDTPTRVETSTQELTPPHSEQTVLKMNNENANNIVVTPEEIARCLSVEIKLDV